jgi:hypothetical protein
MWGGVTMKGRMRGDGGVYLRGNLWWIYYQKDGKQVLESAGSRIKQDAMKLLKDRLANPADKDVLVRDLLDMLLQDYEDRGKKGCISPRVISNLCIRH